MNLDEEIKKELNKMGKFPASRQEMIDEDKSGQNKVGTQIISRFIIDGENLLGRYIYTNEKIKSLTIKDPSILDTPIIFEGEKDYEYLWVHRTDLFLARMAQTQDMFGGIFKWPRTAYVPSNSDTRLISGTTITHMKDTRANLYPEDVDQIIYCAHIFPGEYGEFPEDALAVGICRIKKVEYNNDSGGVIDVESIRVILHDKILSRDKERKIHTTLPEIEIVAIPRYVFGPGWKFKIADTKMSVLYPKPPKAEGFSSDMIEHLFHSIIILSQNWNSFFTYDPAIVYKPDYNIFAAFQLPMIPFFVARDKDQMEGRRASGRWTVERAAAIINPSSIKSLMSVRNSHSASVNCIRIPLRMYNRRG